MLEVVQDLHLLVQIQARRHVLAVDRAGYIWVPFGNMIQITQIRNLSALKDLDHEL